MSASLVGSEMCIRDSRPPPDPPTSAYGGRQRRLLGGVRKGGSPRGEREPVSYTHLTLPTICSV
eukprot:1148977-Alexandrium_andersonii.AAC.1